MNSFKLLFFTIFIVFIFQSAFSQCISGDCYNGQGKMKYSDGSSYEGNWLYGAWHGSGILNYANGSWYSGNWKMGVKHGEGTFYWSTDGNKYVGEWFGDAYTGMGSMKHIYGVKTGEWINNQFYEAHANTSVCKSGNCINGNGTLVFPSGSSYAGGFVDGNFSGYGIMNYNNGNTYEGSWFKGAFHGKGIYTYKSGVIYNGEFQYGVRHGFGTYTWTNGSYFEGYWFGNKRSGIGKEIGVDKSIKNGFWINDVFIKKLPEFNFYSKITDQEVITKINKSKSILFEKYNKGEVSPIYLTDSYAEIGRLLLNHKLYNEALEFLDYSYELFPKNSVAIMLRAYTYKFMGNVQLACNEYLKINDIVGYRYRLDGFYSYSGDTSLNGLRNGTGVMTYCDGFIEKGLWLDGAYIGEWKYIDNRHKCYNCNSKFSISRKLSAQELSNIRSNNVILKNNNIDLYECSQYCSSTCKTIASVKLKKAMVKQQQNNNNNDINRSNTSYYQNVKYPCQYCNKSENGEQVKQSISDYNCYLRQYDNFRYQWRPGYEKCSTCYGVGALNGQTNCGETCYICKGDRFIPCHMCNGTSLRPY